MSIEKDLGKAGKLGRSLSIGGNDRKIPDSMRRPVKGTGSARVSEPVIEYGLDLASIGKSGSDHSKGAIFQSPAGKDSIPSGDRGKGSVPGVDRIDVVHRVDNKDPVPGVDRERTVVPVEVVDVPDQDINSTGSSVKDEVEFS